MQDRWDGGNIMVQSSINNSNEYGFKAAIVGSSFSLSCVRTDGDEAQEGDGKRKMVLEFFKILMPMTVFGTASG